MYIVFMAHFHIKTKKGRPYLYVREIARVNGKPKVISQVYLGSPERLVAMVKNDKPLKEYTLQAQEFGSIWLALQLDKDVELVKIIDKHIPPQKKETGPSVGEYFLYCVCNRMIKAVSKNRLANWYRNTAIQHLRPVDLSELTSQRYWEKWNRVSKKQIEEIARSFFRRIWEIESPDSDCLLFDTTNYYTFMASHTKSELAVRGNNKACRHHLRQVGLALLVSRYSRLPLYYHAYPGNMHDSKLFQHLMDDMFGIICGFYQTKQRLTVVIDKGMNSEENLYWIDEHRQMHFITSYSSYFAEELATAPLSKFEVVDTQRNRELVEAEQEEERLLAYRTEEYYWGKKRAVIVTYNPATARKKNYTFDAKLEALRQELLTMRRKVKERQQHWRDKEKIKERYYRQCERLHLSSTYYKLDITENRDGLTMSFTRDVYTVDKKRLSFGKNIIITDNLDWSTADLVEAHLDRWEVEHNFRLSKNDEVVSVAPLRHWTDSKIRCHLFTCVVAMTQLRRLELRLASAGIHRSAEEVMEEMKNLHSILVVADQRSTPIRKIEQPSKTQSEDLSAFGYQVDRCGVLQPII
jgi:transposase